MKNKTNGNIFFNIIKVVFFLILILIIFKIAPNYEKNDSYVKNKINLIINNNNVTKRLKYDLFIDDKNTIYMSKEDIKNYFDEYIMIDEEIDSIITTYGEKVGVLPINEDIIKINDSTVDVLSGAILKDEVYYLPISAMGKIYNVDVDYIKDKKILVLDSLDKELLKGNISKNLKIKYKSTIFSKKMDKLKKGDIVIVLEMAKSPNAWTKVRTRDGFIGFVKQKYLQNLVYVRKDIIAEENNEKINLVWDYFSEYAKAPNREGTQIEGINVVSPSFFSLVSKGNGKIYDNVGNEGIEYINWAKQNNYKVWAMFSNNSYKETTTKILGSYELRNKLINNIVNLVVKYELDGINLDFENMNESDKDNYSRFIIELKPRLQEAGVKLSVDVTAPDGGSNWSECYDRNIIGNVADYIVFMAYDQYGTGSTKAGTTAGYNWIETNLNKFVGREEIDSNKVILGIPFYTRIWTESNGSVTSKTVNIKDIDNVLPSNTERKWIEELKQYYVEYNKNGKKYMIWIEDEKSIKEKVGLVNKYQLAGTAAWKIGMETENILKIIKDGLN